MNKELLIFLRNSYKMKLRKYNMKLKVYPENSSLLESIEAYQEIINDLTILINTFPKIKQS